MQTKFATPILHVINNFRIYDIFSTYTKPLIVSFVYFLEISSHLHLFNFTSFQLETVCSIRKQIIKCSYLFYYVIGSVYIYSWKKIDKSLIHFDDALCEK